MGVHYIVKLGIAVSCSESQHLKYWNLVFELQCMLQKNSSGGHLTVIRVVGLWLYGNVDIDFKKNTNNNKQCYEISNKTIISLVHFMLQTQST